MNTARLNQGTPLLLNAVSKHYGGKNIVLNQLDLHIPAGQFVAVVGRSGGRQKYPAAPAGRSGTRTAGDVLAGTTPLAEDPGRHANDVSGCASAAVEIGD